MANWLGEAKAENSRLREVNEALSAWKHARWQGRPKDEIERKKAALDAAKQKYIRER